MAPRSRSQARSAHSVQELSPTSSSDGPVVGDKDPITVERIEASTKDAQHGAGPYPESQARPFSLLSIIGLAYAILNSWTAMAASLSVALPSGGPTAVIWGILISFLGNLAMAASLAEIAHVYPTSGGQYHFAAILSTPDWAPIVSYFSGWLTCAGWVSLTATTGSLAGALITGAISLANPDYVVQPFHIFLIYSAYIVGAMIINIWLPRILPFLNKMAIFWSLAGAGTIAIVCLSVAGHNGNFESPTFVFGTFINETGWNDGIAWILGLLQSSFGLTAFDGVLHMVEEMPEPHLTAPKAMVLAVIIGSGSSFIFLICLLFSINDVDGVISSSAGALLASMYQATGSIAGSIVLQVFPIASMAFAAQGISTAASRMLMAFARDGGFPFSPIWSRLSKRGVPDNALYLNAVLVIIFGLVYLGSSSALNAILSSSVVFLNISYSIPIAILLFRGRHLLRPPSFPEPTLTLGPILGPIANVVGLLFTVMTTVFFLFPPDLPVTGNTMNYACVVLALVLIMSTTWWLAIARKTYTGPKNLGGLLEMARAEMDDPTRFNPSSSDDEARVVPRSEKETKTEF